MAKKQKQPTKTCADCIHENACRMWTDGRFISDVSASVCPNHETVKNSAAYLCGVLDERNRKKTNADRIRAMSDIDLATFIYRATRACNEYDCDNCPIGDENCPNLTGWLKQPAKEET